MHALIFAPKENSLFLPRASTVRWKISAHVCPGRCPGLNYKGLSGLFIICQSRTNQKSEKYDPLKLSEKQSKTIGRIAAFIFSGILSRNQPPYLQEKLSRQCLSYLPRYHLQQHSVSHEKAGRKAIRWNRFSHF